MYGGIPWKFSYLQLPSYIDSFMPEMWLCKKYSCLQELFLFFVSYIIGNTNLSIDKTNVKCDVNNENIFGYVYMVMYI